MPIEKEKLLEIIRTSYDKIPQAIKDQVIYLGVTGSFLFNLEKENSDHDLSIIFDKELVDETLIMNFKRYITLLIRQELINEGYQANVVDVHCIRNIRWTNVNNVIALFCMKYQIENKMEMGVKIDDEAKFNENINYYFDITFEDLLNDYIKYNRFLLSRVLYLPKTDNYMHINSVFYHLFLMYNLVHHGSLYTDEISRDDVLAIKRLVKGKLNMFNLKEEFSYLVLDEQTQDQLYAVLQEKLAIVLKDEQMYPIDEIKRLNF